VIQGATRAEIPETHISADHIDSGLARFHAALEASYRELQQLQARVQSELGPGQSEIFSAHLLFLEDPQFIESVETRIRNDRYRLESAIQVTVDDLARLPKNADNAYLRERAADMCDLRARLLRHTGSSAMQPLAEPAPESVLIARELLPSDLLEFDREHLVGTPFSRPPISPASGRMI
jgi:phosphoenolpyruvate-protein kinase (PTS system EI component)